MNNNTIGSEVNRFHCHPGFSWSAIVFGALVGTGLAFLLHLFSIAIGLSAYNSLQTGAGSTIAIGGFIGLVIGVIASMGTAGFVSGYIAKDHHPDKQKGVIYGFVTWTLALLLAAIFVVPLSYYIASYDAMLSPEMVVAHSINKNIDVTEKTQSANDAHHMDNNPVIKVTPGALTGASWLVFALFIIGAFSSCIGACMAMCCRASCGDRAY